MKPIRLCAVLLAAATIGCASTPTPGDERAPSPRRQANVITLVEIENRPQARDAYDLVHGLRPEWFRTRGQHSLRNTSAGQVVVYVDGARGGGVPFLREVLARNVQAVHFLGAAEATSRYGTGHSGGAILIVTRRG